jgi:plastocyanin
MMKLTSLFAVAGLTLALAACGGADAAPRQGGASEGKVAASASATGNVIEVKMVSGSGERFEPANFTAKRGDVVRFVLVAGVHNVSFPAANNVSGVQLPATSPYLQAPGQSYEFTVEQPAGEYNYQCDPHAALGMVGTMTVVD